MTADRLDPHLWDGEEIGPGQRKTVSMAVGWFYSAPLHVPVHIWRAQEPGPVVFVTAAVHGDEINGTGTIRELLLDPPFDLVRGTLLLVPVVNLLGFERHSRYLPDRRDLNRCFPGSPGGSLASRYAHAVFSQIVRRADLGVDLHTAAVRRTNYPNLRADLEHPEVAKLAAGFQTELLVHSDGSGGTLRRAASDAGCPTVLLEAGEVWKAEQTIVEYSQRILRNGLIALGMVDGEPTPPDFPPVVVEKSSWLRADVGGFLQFHVGPGDLVEKGDPVWTNTSLTGEERNVVVAPRSGIVLGMTTLPSVAPGDAVVHLGVTSKRTMRRLEEAVGKLGEDSLHERLREDLSSGIAVYESDEEDEEADADDDGETE